MQIKKSIRIALPGISTAIVTTMLATLGAGLMLAQPWLASKLTLSLTNEKAPFPIELLVLGWGVVLIGKSVAGYIIAIRSETQVLESSEKLRLALYKSLLASHYQSLLDKPSGYQNNLFVSDVESLASFLGLTLLNLAPTALLFFGSVFAIYRIDGSLAIFIVLLSTFYLLALRFFSRSLRELSLSSLDARDQTSSFVQETSKLSCLVQAYSVQQRFESSFQALNKEQTSTSLQLLKTSAKISPMLGLAATLSVLGLVFYSSGLVTPEGIGLDKLVAVIGYGLLVLVPVKSFMGAFSETLSVLASAERLDQLLENPKRILHGGTQVLAEPITSITLDAIEFSYGDQPLLRDINLTATSGDLIVIRGPNGSGKSTLLRIILGLEHVHSGNVHFNGKRSTSLNIEHIRTHMGYVPQDNLLLNGTVFENIQFCRTEIARKDIVSSAEDVGASDFIHRLSDGFETEIGASGHKLSGGQQQRIAIARAIASRPSLLVLDEPMSMHDERARNNVIEFLQNYSSKNIVIVASHEQKLMDIATRVIKLTPPQ